LVGGAERDIGIWIPVEVVNLSHPELGGDFPLFGLIGVQAGKLGRTDNLGFGYKDVVTGGGIHGVENLVDELLENRMGIYWAAFEGQMEGGQVVGGQMWLGSHVESWRGGLLEMELKPSGGGGTEYGCSCIAGIMGVHV
jgi:hypothetical protein